MLGRGPLQEDAQRRAIGDAEPFAVGGRELLAGVVEIASAP